jgi:hypothetical protein
MANFGYDPTGTGKYGVGVLWNGVSGVNVLADGTVYYGNIDTITALPAGAQAGGDSASKSPSGKKFPVVISVPGNIITEESVAGNEELIIEELFEDLSLFELMDMGRSETVLGQNISYVPIKNISDIYFTYSPKNILALQGTFGDTEASSALRFNQYALDGAVSIDPETGDLVIAVDNVRDGFVVQVELLAGGEIKDS